MTDREQDENEDSNLSTRGRRQKYEKVRLNIAVSKEAVQRAKAADINISAEVDEYLKVLTYRPKPEFSDIVRAYDGFLRSIQFALSKYDPYLNIEIGEIPDRSHLKEEVKRGEVRKEAVFFGGCKIFLDMNVASILKDGRHYAQMDSIEKYDFLLDPDEMNSLYPPKKILMNLISEIKKANANNTNEIQKLNLATKFVKAMFNDTDKGKENSSDSGSGSPAIRQILGVISAEGKAAQSSPTSTNSREENQRVVMTA
jgi:hypothetical protein